MLPKISATLCITNSGKNFKNYILFSVFFAEICIFDFSAWQGRECACSEIFFLRDPHWVGVKPNNRPKCRMSPSRAVKNLFSFLIMDFGWNFIRKHEKSIFDVTLRLWISTNTLQNFVKPRLRTFWGKRVPIMLPKMSETLSIRYIGNNGNNSQIQILEFQNNFIIDFGNCC